MFGFSSKMLITQVFIIINQNLFSVLLGKFYTKQEVGDFSQANNWNNKGHALITGMINGVTQPVLASVANDPQRQAAVFHKMLRFTAFISFPAMFGLSLISREFILIAITDKWLASARIMQLLCIWGAFIPINNLFSLLLVSRGRSSIFMFNSIALSVYQLSIRHHHHDLSVCRYQYRVAVCLVLLCPEGDSADAVQHTERYRSLFSAGSFADNRSPLHNVGHH